MNLPNDVARCDGMYLVGGFDLAMQDHECASCIRRIAQQTDPRGKTVAYMHQPEFIDGKCPERIAN